VLPRLIACFLLSCASGFFPAGLSTCPIATAFQAPTEQRRPALLVLSRSQRQQLHDHPSRANVITHLQPPRNRYTQVISDVDDTLKSSGGVNIGGVALGGIDAQYSRGDVYPGVAEFYLHLSLNPATNIAPKVAVLTARAEEFKSLLELKESSKVAQALSQAGARANVPDWGLGPVLYGSVAEWIAQDRKGLRKFSNFERLLSQDPSGELMQYVYVGDTGELDQEAGETMLREYPEVVQAVFLHVVSDKPYPRIPPFRVINGRPVVFFRTYVGAAVAAVQLQLMTQDGLRAVVNAACDKLAGVPQSSDKWIDLRKDLERANRILKVE
jgi:hypothetical protein